MSRGEVYVLINDSMPGIYKVGCTTGVPENRAYQLSASSAVPTPFRVLFSLAHDDCHSAERAVHRSLEPKRVNRKREFFRGPEEEIFDAISAATGEGWR